jgi:hypothetical protein
MSTTTTTTQPVLLRKVYEPNTKENVHNWSQQYEMLRQKGVKLTNNPQTEEEAILRKLYNRLKYQEKKQSVGAPVY